MSTSNSPPSSWIECSRSRRASPIQRLSVLGCTPRELGWYRPVLWDPWRERDFLLKDCVEVRQAVMKWEQGSAATTPLSPRVRRSPLVELSTSCVADKQEAPLVSAVASSSAAEATRDRAVVRTGDGPAAGGETPDARVSLLALLLT